MGLISRVSSRTYRKKYINMSITSDDVRTRLEQLKPAHLEVEDKTPVMCSTSFEVTIVSEQFVGKRLLQRHRLVNDALKDIMPEIHAFTQVTMTPEEFEKKKSDS